MYNFGYQVILKRLVMVFTVEKLDISRENARTFSEIADVSTIIALAI